LKGNIGRLGLARITKYPECSHKFNPRNRFLQDKKVVIAKQIQSQKAKIKPFHS
jgi:hypothetical protein